MSVVDLDEAPSEMLMPDPPAQRVRYTLISVDDHLVEPPWLFEGRLPRRYADGAPRVIEQDDGTQAWVFDGQVYEQLGLNAQVGRADRDDVTFEPARFSDMRRGAWDIHERIGDMDIAGIWASVCFPSVITGFCGRVYSECSDPDLGLAVTRAFNDWIHEEWWGAYPERIVPMGITWLRDPTLAAAEIRRNAERGFTAVTLPENPARMGLPSIHDRWWDPLLAACEETETVICLHTGSSGHWMPQDDAGPHLAVRATLFQMHAYVAAAEWVWSGIPLRFPNIRIALSEGGCGWVPTMYDRMRHQMEVSGHGRQDWPADATGPPRVAAAQRVVLQHQRPLQHRRSGGAEPEPPDDGDRLPPRRQHLAGLPGRPGGDDRPPARRRDRGHLSPQRRSALPPPPARRNAALIHLRPTPPK